MCSEFWSGWFDHWGRKHETRDGQIMVDGLKEMMDKGISFSLYMTHGGTTFGCCGSGRDPLRHQALHHLHRRQVRLRLRRSHRYRHRRPEGADPGRPVLRDLRRKRYQRRHSGQCLRGRLSRK